MTDTSITDNVTPLRPTKAKRTDNTAALRQRRSRAKGKRVTPVPATAIAQIAQPEKPSKINADVTVSCRETGAANVTQSRRTNYALVVIAYGFFLLGIGINVWNATFGGTIADMALPAALGVLAEAVVFFLPAWALTLPIGRQLLALGALRVHIGLRPDEQPAHGQHHRGGPGDGQGRPAD